MKNLVLLMLGVGLGFFAAHQYNKTVQGRDFFETVGEKAREFSSAVVDGYRARENELTAQHTTSGQYADR
jgi:hypothetical protein